MRLTLAFHQSGGGGWGSDVREKSWEDCVGIVTKAPKLTSPREEALRRDCTHVLAMSGIAELTLRAPRMLPSTSGYSSPRYSYKTTPKWPISFSYKPSNQNTRLMPSLPARKGQDNYKTQTYQQNRLPYNTRTLLQVNVILKGGKRRKLMGSFTLICQLLPLHRSSWPGRFLKSDQQLAVEPWQTCCSIATGWYHISEVSKASLACQGHSPLCQSHSASQCPGYMKEASWVVMLHEFGLGLGSNNYSL